MSHEFAKDRYERMPYRRCGRSGLLLPAVCLGAWETYGGYIGEDIVRDCLYRAFDLGITHFDLANNYGSPGGNAERVCGKIFKDMPRDELIISSKAGYRMWPGPYGEFGSRKYIIASCDQSLKRLGLDYVDIFYSHRPDPQTPFEETMAALDQLVRQGKALYAGISNYSGTEFVDCARICQNKGYAPVTIHQPRYNMLDRGVEEDLLPYTAQFGVGVIPYSPLGNGLLSTKYLSGKIPPGSRADEETWGGHQIKDYLAKGGAGTLNALNDIAKERGQTLAQMALAWILRLPAITSVLIGASSVAQIEENVKALDNLSFSREELDKIDKLTKRQE